MKNQSLIEAINSNKPVIVDFYTKSCLACRNISPVLEELMRNMGEKVLVKKVNAENKSELLEHYGLMAIPILVLFKAGEIKWWKSGNVEVDIIEKEISKALQ